MKLTIFHVFPYLICYSWANSKVLFHTLVTTIVKTWRMLGRWKWGRENVQYKKSSSGNSPFWKVFIVELFFGEVSVGDLCMGKCQLENCPDINLSVKLSQRTALKSFIKKAMTSSFHTEPCVKPFSLSKTTTYGFSVFKRIV